MSTDGDTGGQCHYTSSLSSSCGSTVSFTLTPTISSMLQAIALDHTYHSKFKDQIPQILLSSSLTESASCTGKKMTNKQRTHRTVDSPYVATPYTSSTFEAQPDAQDSLASSSPAQLLSNLPRLDNTPIAKPDKQQVNKRETCKLPNRKNPAMHTHRKPQYVCHIGGCQKVFAKPFGLNKHLASYHGKKSLIVMRKIELISEFKKCRLVVKRIGSKRSNHKDKVFQSCNQTVKSPETSIQNNHNRPVQVITASSIWQSMFDTEVPATLKETSTQRSSDTCDGKSVMSLDKVPLRKTDKPQKQRKKCQYMNCTNNAESKMSDSKGKILHVRDCGKVYNHARTFRQHLVTHDRQKTTSKTNLVVKRIESKNVDAENQILQNSNLTKTSFSSDFNIQKNSTPLRVITASSIWETVLQTNN